MLCDFDVDDTTLCELGSEGIVHHRYDKPETTEDRDSVTCKRCIRSLNRPYWSSINKESA